MFNPPNNCKIYDFDAEFLNRNPESYYDVVQRRMQLVNQKHKEGMLALWTEQRQRENQAEVTFTLILMISGLLLLVWTVGRFTGHW
jgi:uncharacterized Rmd1/YagE family protein